MLSSFGSTSPLRIASERSTRLWTKSFNDWLSGQATMRGLPPRNLGTGRPRHLRSADVGHFAEHRHQLGHVDKTGEARVHAVAAAIWRDFQRRYALPEGCR